MKRIVFALAVGMSFAAGIAGTLGVQRWTANQDIAVMIAGARTPTHHAALASYFEEEAAENRRKVDFHARLRKVYGEFHPDWRLAMHCEDMVQYFGKIADQDSDLAPEHRKLAKEIR